MTEVTLTELIAFIKPKGIITDGEVTVHRVDPTDSAQS